MEEQVVANLVAKVGVHAEAKGLEHILEKLEFFKKAIEGFIVVAAIHKLYELGESLAALGEGLETSAIQTGLTTDRLQERQYAASQNAVSADALTGAMSRLGRIMFQAQKGSKTAVDTFARLGISPAQVKGFESLDDALYAVQDGISGFSSQQEKLAVTQQLFGRGGGKFLKFLEVGSDETKELMKRAQAVGAVIGENNVKALAEFEDASSSLKLVFRGFGANITGAFLPILTNAMRMFETWWGGVQGAVVRGLTWFGREFVYYGYVASRYLMVFGEFIRRILFGGEGIGGSIHNFLANVLDQAAAAGGKILELIEKVVAYFKASNGAAKLKEFAQTTLALIGNILERQAEFIGRIFDILAAPASPDDTFLVKVLRAVAHAAEEAVAGLMSTFQWVGRLFADGGVVEQLQKYLLYGKGSAGDLLKSIGSSFDAEAPIGDVIDRVVRVNTTRSLAVPNLGDAMQQALRPPPMNMLRMAAGSGDMPVSSVVNVYAKTDSSPEDIAAAIAQKQQLALPKMLAETKRDFQSQLRW